MGLEFSAFRSSEARATANEAIESTAAVISCRQAELIRYQRGLQTEKGMVFNGTFPKVFTSLLVNEIEYERMLLLETSIIVFAN